MAMLLKKSRIPVPTAHLLPTDKLCQHRDPVRFRTGSLSVILYFFLSVIRPAPGCGQLRLLTVSRFLMI